MFISREHHRQAIRDEALRRRIAILQTGKIFHLISDRVNIKTSDLAYINVAELGPLLTVSRPRDAMQ